MGLLRRRNWRRQTITPLVHAALPLTVPFIAALLLASSSASTPAAAAPNPFAQLSQEHAASPGTVSDRSSVAEALRSSPVMFIENVGQFDERARFQVRGGTGTIWLAEDAIWITVLETPPQPSPMSGREPCPPFAGGLRGDVDGGTEGSEPRRGVHLKLTFPGANPHPRLEPFNRLDTHVSYFIGNDPVQWHPNVPVWGGVRYVDLYPGIDLELTSENGRMVQRLVVRDGTPSLTLPLRGGGNEGGGVRLRVEGADAVQLLPSPDPSAPLRASVGRGAGGEGLRLTTAVGNFTLPLPTAEFPFQIEGVTTSGQRSAFDVQPATAEATVVPQDNPSDLLYTTFLGGSGDDGGLGIAVDGSGAAYVTGYTASSDFPTTPGAFDTTHIGNEDAFVVKLNAAGSALAYATFLGGSSSDWGRGIAVDGSGAAYATGDTGSSDFPTTPGAFDTSYNGIDDAFVAKLAVGGGGPPTPFLDLPFEYTNFGEATLANKGGRGPGRVNAWFDHTYPNYGRNYNLTLWNGRIYTGAEQTYDDCLSYGTCYDGHNGIDFSYADPQPSEPGDQPLPIRPAAGGVISKTVTACSDSCRYGSCLACGAYGNYVIVNHRNHYFTRYAHLREVYVSEGQSVTTADTLGIMGATGHVEGRGDGTHLHFSVYYDDNDGTWSENEVVDPFDWRGSPPEPWEANGGPTSYYLWIHQVSTQDPVSGDQGATMTDATGHIQAIIPPGAFSGQAILELSPVREAEPSAQLRSSGHSFWLRLLEWLLGGGGLQSTTTLQSTTQLTLTKPITLTVTYTDTDVLHLDVSQLALHRWDEEQETWQSMTTTVDSDNHVVIAQTEDLGDFDLQAPLLCATDDLEPDDGYAAAHWVWPNDWPLARGLDIPQDSDWGRFDAVQGARYTVRTQSLAGGADTVLNLYDVDALTLLASNNDADGGPASELVWTAPYTGTFFIETVSAPGGTTGCSATYELTIATIPGDVIADCQVDIADIQAVASRWRLKASNPDPDNDPTTPNYETRFDVDEDGDVDVADVMHVAARWGQICS
jgi:murein DD-endopeptidase MepM/ murein hydrolase activator NlpD